MKLKTASAAFINYDGIKGFRQFTAVKSAVRRQKHQKKLEDNVTTTGVQKKKEVTQYKHRTKPLEAGCAEANINSFEKYEKKRHPRTGGRDVKNQGQRHEQNQLGKQGVWPRNKFEKKDRRIEHTGGGGLRTVASNTSDGEPGGTKERPQASHEGGGGPVYARGGLLPVEAGQRPPAKNRGDSKNPLTRRRTNIIQRARNLTKKATCTIKNTNGKRETMENQIRQWQYNRK